ncbi:hypothetical protein [Lacihabitans soyangensis]|uniref:Uncharacterized protein n=1 Tax=Lacihabitans soyangensis TaxID=869394 RepID=A0AAE3KXA8_9BACT|nr:hypothetical protein [Lacihabitans soyangensis]MCP9764485.1 hypothetical protein [Lacihabitans soyangensis]
MKAENFDKVKVLMEERERLASIVERVAQSDIITFSKQGAGRQDFTLSDSHSMFDEFRGSVVKLCKENIKEVDEKLKDL